MNTFTLKIIAAVTMFIDHAGKALIGQVFWMQATGRFAFPLFSWMVAEGYHYTKNIRKYILRLFVVACISQIPFVLVFYGLQDSWLGYLRELNVVFTLLLGLLSILAFEYFKKFHVVAGGYAVFLLALLSAVTPMDFSGIGVLSVFFFHFFRGEYWKVFLSQVTIFLIGMIGFFQQQFTLYFAGRIDSPIFAFVMFFYILPLLLIPLSNAKRGPRAKYFFYIFYPAHLFILGVAALYLGG